MKTYFLLILAAGLLGLSSCSEKDNLLNFKLDTPFTLGFQEQAVWDDNSEVKIQFDRVLGDSRCPIDAECVWAGRIEVEVSFTQDGKTEKDVLLLGDAGGSDYSDTATFGDFTVKLLQVKPLPKANVIIPEASYTLELRISKSQ